MSNKKLHDTGDPLPEGRAAINFADAVFFDEAEEFCELKTRLARSLEEFAEAVQELDLGEFTVRLEAEQIERNIPTMHKRWKRQP